MSNENIDRTLAVRGGDRADLIHDAVASTYLMMRKRRPDIKAADIVVDLTDAPGGYSVKWTLHTGDHQPSAFDRQYTNQYGAAEYLRREAEVTQ
jgi:hypothetical protein